jgi:hypothetical protein
MATVGAELAPQHKFETACPECASVLHGKYCHQCGSRPVDHHEYTLRHFFSHVLHEATHFDSKIFITVRVMVARPGQLVADYLSGRRRRYVPPLRLFLIVFALQFFLYTAVPTTAVYNTSFVSHSSSNGANLDRFFAKVAQKRHVSPEFVEEQVNERWHKGATLLQLGDVFAFAICVAILFHSRKRYFVEHLIFSLNMCTFALGLSLLTWPYYLWRGGVQGLRLPVMLISFVLMTSYLFLAARRVYGGRNGKLAAQSIAMFLAIEAARIFFIMVTFLIAFFSVIPR